LNCIERLDKGESFISFEIKELLMSSNIKGLRRFNSALKSFEERLGEDLRVLRLMGFTFNTNGLEVLRVVFKRLVKRELAVNG